MRDLHWRAERGESKLLFRQRNKELVAARTHNSGKRAALEAPVHAGEFFLSAGINQYLATAANAIDHTVKRRVLAIDWIVRIIHQVLLRRHLISTRLAMPDWRLRYRLLVRSHQRSWGWISRTNRLRNRHRSVDQGQQRYRRDQLSHDGSPEFGGPPSHDDGSGETRPQGAQISRFVQDVPSALARLEGWASSGR
jgi:hypothetical protein